MNLTFGNHKVKKILVIQSSGYPDNICFILDSPYNQFTTSNEPNLTAMTAQNTALNWLKNTFNIDPKDITIINRH
jgi:hypothetical protein